MPGLKIDLDRGILYEVPVSKRPRGGVSMRRDPETGSDVFMYRAEPGKYYSANGLEVSATMAKRAGFDTEFLAKEAEKIRKMKEFQADWEAENESRDRRIIEERGDYMLVYVAGSGYYVEHTDGTIMTREKRASTEQAGLDWLTDFAGPKRDGNVPGADRPSSGGTDRRSGPDEPANTNVRKSGDKKAPVSA